jgi:hypothetical protein
LIHRNEPNRPHISSDIEFSKSAETKQTGSANPISATRQPYLYSQCLTSPQSTAPKFRSAKPTSTSAPPVEEDLGKSRRGCNPFFRGTSHFLHQSRFVSETNVLVRLSEE